MNHHTKLIAALAFFLLVFFVSNLTYGLYTIDEREYLYLARSLAEKQSISSLEYFPGHVLTSSEAGLVACFSPYGSVVYPHMYRCKFGYSLVAFPFYKLFGFYGLPIVNIITTILAVCLIYLLGKKIWGNEDCALTSAILYGLASFSIFYATSLWYHSLLVASYLAAQASLLYYTKERRYLLTSLFLISSSICVWTSYYMFLPIAVLFLGFMAKTNLRGKITLLFIYFASTYLTWPSETMKNKSIAAVGSVASKGKSTGLPNLVASKIGLFALGFVSMLYSRLLVWDEWVGVQKAVLETAPYLIAAVFGLMAYKGRERRGLYILLLSNVALALLAIGYAGHRGDWGGWELNMRYLLPVVPTLAILSAKVVSDIIKPWHLFALLIASTIITSVAPVIGFTTTPYYLMRFAASAFVLLYLLAGLIGLRHRLNILLILMVVLSNVVNVNDMHLGKEFRRDNIASAEEVAANTPEGSVVVISRLYEMSMFEDRSILYYPTTGVDAVSLTSSISQTHPTYVVIPTFCEVEGVCEEGLRIVEQLDAEKEYGSDNMILYKIT